MPLDAEGSLEQIKNNIQCKLLKTFLLIFFLNPGSSDFKLYDNKSKNKHSKKVSMTQCQVL